MGKRERTVGLNLSHVPGVGVGVGDYYHPHFRDEETQSDLSKVMYSVSGRAGILSWAAWLHGLNCQESVTFSCMDPFPAVRALALQTHC